MSASTRRSCTTSRHWQPVSSRLRRIGAALLLGLTWPAAGRAEDAADLDAHPLVRVARALEAQGSRTQAITEYKRYLFFAPGSGFEGDVTCRISLLLRQDGRTDDALEAFSRAAVVASSPALRLQCHLARAATLIAAGRTAEAEVLLLALRASSPQGESGRRIAYYLLLSSMAAYRWTDALAELDRAYPPETRGAEGTDDAVSALGAALMEASRRRSWSERTAQWLSVFLPGAGQLYAGELWDGLNALAVNGLSGALVVSLVLNRRYGEAALTLLYLFNRFYFGNIDNARRAARERTAGANRLTLGRLGPITEGLPPP